MCVRMYVCILHENNEREREERSCMYVCILHENNERERERERDVEMDVAQLVRLPKGDQEVMGSTSTFHNNIY